MDTGITPIIDGSIHNGVYVTPGIGGCGGGHIHSNDTSVIVGSGNNTDEMHMQGFKIIGDNLTRQFIPLLKVPHIKLTILNLAIATEVW